MRKYKSLTKRLGALALTFTMALSPMGAMAAEVEGQEAEQQEIEEPGIWGEPEVESGAQAQTEEGGLTAEKTVMPDGGTDVEEEHLPDGKTDNQETETSEETDESKLGVAGEEVPEADGENAETLAARAFDVTPPEIKEVIFEQNRQTIKQDEELKLAVRAADPESGIKEMTAVVHFYNEIRRSSADKIMTLTQNKTDKELFEGSIPMDGVICDSGRISEIKAVNGAGGQTKKEGYEYLFYVDAKKIEAVTVSELNFERVGETLTAGDTVNFSFRAEPNGKEQVDFNLNFSTMNGANRISTQAEYDAESGLYKGTINIWNGSSEGKMQLLGIDCRTSGKQLEVRVQNPEDIWYQVEISETDEKTDSEPPKILSASLDKNTKTVTAGETVTVTVEAEDNEALGADGAYATFYPILDIAEDVKEIPLEYRNGRYVGKFEVTEETYPCEWYLERIRIEDEAGNRAYWNAPYKDGAFGNRTYESYISVQQEEQTANPEYDVTLSFYALNENGKFEEIKTETKTGIKRRQTYKEAGFEFPENPEYKGKEFQGWFWSPTSSAEFGMLTEEAQIVSGGHQKLYAKYNMPIVHVTAQYYDEEGYKTSDSKYLCVEEGTLVKDVLDKVRNYVPEEKEYAGLHRDGWKLDGSYSEEQPIQDGMSIQMKANYKERLVRFIADDKYRESYEFDNGNVYRIPGNLPNIVDIRVVEPGTVIELPKKTEEYENLQWVFGVPSVFITQEVLKTGKIEVNKDDVQIFGYGDKIQTVEEPENPTNPENPAEPENPDNPQNPAEPEAPSDHNGFSEEAIAQMVESIAKLNDGDTYSVDMTSTTVVPKEILQAARGKNISLYFCMYGYTWTVNGMDISASEIRDIDLEVIFDTDAIPGDVVKTVSGESQTRQFSLRHEGDFGFRAVLTMNVGEPYAGKNGTLYWYNNNQELEFIDENEIQPDGQISLVFSHASDYVLVMNDKTAEPGNPDTQNPAKPESPGAQDDSVSGNQPDKEAGKSQPDGRKAEDTKKASPKTGDMTPMMSLLGLLAVSGSAAGAAGFRKRRKK